MLLFGHVGLALVAARFAPEADLALVALGSMLPDLIDKPLGLLVYGTPAMGRIYAHTLLFLILLALLAVLTWNVRLASLAGGVLAHLALDSMWESPATLLWPLLGDFPLSEKVSAMGYLQMLFAGFLHDPWVSVPEILGLMYLLFLGYEHRSGIEETMRRLASKHKSLAHLAQMLVWLQRFT